MKFCAIIAQQSRIKTGERERERQNDDKGKKIQAIPNIDRNVHLPNVQAFLCVLREMR